MADETNDEDKPPSEGVRLIGADEAAEALGRDDVARRLTDEDRKPGDRPAEQPYDGPPPTVSFPLSNRTSPEEVERPSLIDDRVDLPHWTEPATGEVPAILRRDEEDEAPDDEWASFTGSTPRWRDSGDDFDDERDDVRALGGDSGMSIGALDETDRPSDSDFFSFSDIDEPQQGRSVFADDDTADSDDDAYDDGAYDEADDGDDYYDDDEYDDDGTYEDPVVIGTGRLDQPDAGFEPDSGGRNIGQALGVGLGFAADRPGGIRHRAGRRPRARARGGQPRRPRVLHRRPARPATSRPHWSASWPSPRSSSRPTTGARPPFLPCSSSRPWWDWLWYLAGAGGKRPTANLGVTLLGVLWIGMFGSFAALCCRLPMASVCCSGPSSRRSATTSAASSSAATPASTRCPRPAPTRPGKGSSAA